MNKKQLQSPAGARSSQLVMFFALLSPPHGSSLVFKAFSVVPPPKALNPTAASIRLACGSLRAATEMFRSLRQVGVLCCPLRYQHMPQTALMLRAPVCGTLAPLAGGSQHSVRKPLRKLRFLQPL